MKALPLWLGLIALLATLASCSSDSDCPTCPKCTSPTVWAAYDSLNDNSLDRALWIANSSNGGQILETSGQLQVWGHTDLWTGFARVRTTEVRLAWRFDLVDESFQNGGGCQGWYIQAVDASTNHFVFLLDHLTAGCVPTWSDVAGAYEIKPEGDSIAVYRSGALVRRVYKNGVDFMFLQFSADNSYGDGAHCHVFIDNVWGLEYKP